MASPKTQARQSLAGPNPGAGPVDTWKPGVIRVALAIQGTVEQYDASGRLTASQPLQVVQVAGLSAEALRASLAGLNEQLAQAWAQAQAGPASVEGTGE